MSTTTTTEKPISGIEGMPPGWRLVGFRIGVRHPTWILGPLGYPEQWRSNAAPSGRVYAVIERENRRVLITETDLPDKMRDLNAADIKVVQLFIHGETVVTADRVRIEECGA